MSRVQTLCSESELAVVQASRRPRLGQLTLAQAKSFTQRARKLFEKWRDQERTQSRTQARKVGSPDTKTRTHDKVQIFQDALASLETRLAQLTETGKGSQPKASRAPSKKARAQGHRASRAEVRAELAEKELVLKATKKSKQPAKIKPAAKAKPAPAAKTKGTAAPRKSKSAARGAEQAVSVPAQKTPAPRQRRAPQPALSGIQKKLADGQIHQQAATVAAKQRRVAKSGLTSRVRGHVSARGRRAQGKRDSRNAE
ncbi:MAG: hypothetical protein KF708_07585 [Pirellulales bacterium]|nr:hypothetical protein [Pirellulales bacterium]